MQSPESATAAGGSSPAAPKPYLRRGSGWAGRVAAVREGRRYVPRGGNIKDYSKEQEVYAPPRAARGRASAPVSRIPRSPAKPVRAARAASVGANAGGYGGRRTAPAAAPPAAPRLQRQPAAARPACTAPCADCGPTQQNQQHRQDHLLSRQLHRPQRDVGPSQPAPLTTQPGAGHWARKLLGEHQLQPAVGGGQEQRHPSWEARQAQADMALEEFEALESQVLREVGNSPLPSPKGTKRAALAAPGSGSRVRPISQGHTGAGRWPAAVPANQGGQQHPEQLGAEGLEGPEDEDVFQSDGEGGVQCGFSAGPNGTAEAAAAGIAHPLACRTVSFGLPAGAAAGGASAVQQPRGPPVYCEDSEEEVEMEAESSFVQDHPPLPQHQHQQHRQQPAPGLVQQFFSRPAVVPAVPGAQQPPAWQAVALGQQLWGPGESASQQQHAAQGPVPATQAEAEVVEQLQHEVVRLQEERARVARLRMELEEAAGKLEQDKEAWEKRKLEEAAQFEAERSEELRKLQRDRRVLEKQSRAILKMPTKQSKEEVAAVEALLAEERRVGRAREARHKLATERLRQQVLELQGRNNEMREQIRYLEQQRLEQQQWAGAAGGAEGAEETATARAGAAGPPLVSSGGSPAAAAAGTGRQRAAGGLPAVKVERGGQAASPSKSIRHSGASAGAAPAAVGAERGRHAGQRLGAGQPPAGSWGAAEEEATFGEQGDEEPLIADVELGEDEVIEYYADKEEEAVQQGPAGAAHLQQQNSHSTSHSTAAWSGAGQLVPAFGAQAGWQPGSAMPGAAAPAPPAAGGAAGATADVMIKASSALARFNQLRASLMQHEGLQGRLAGRLASLQSSPQEAAPLGAPSAGSSTAAAAAPLAEPQFEAATAAPAGFQHDVRDSSGAADDLRRLGRSLLEAGTDAASAAAIPGLPAVQQQLAVPPPLPGAPGDAMVSETQHPDGRWERLFASGLREQHFANGSTKQQLPGSGASLTRFANGDVKKALPCGTIEYFYGEVNSWQVTHPSGVDVFFFPSGQVEAHHPGGVKEILFPDGVVRKVLPDGRELAISAAHLSREIQQAQPLAQLLPAGVSPGASSA